MEQLSGPQRGGSQGMCVEPGDQAGGTPPRRPKLGEAQSTLINVNFKRYAHGLCLGTKVPLTLLIGFMHEQFWYTFVRAKSTASNNAPLK